VARLRLTTTPADERVARRDGLVAASGEYVYIYIYICIPLYLYDSLSLSLSLSLSVYVSLQRNIFLMGWKGGGHA
jgi:hypothetical protein